MSSNEMDCNWITVEFLTKILHKTENNLKIKLIDYTINNATEKGENYLSAMYRINLKYKNDDNENLKIMEKSLIIKSSLNDPTIIDELMIEFQREKTVYNNILPELENLLKTINDYTIFAPKFILSTENALVLEDLSIKNYKIADRKIGLNLIQCKLVLEKIAKLHAVSAVLFIEKPELFKYHMIGNMTKIESPWHIFYKNSIASCIKFTKTIPELNQYIEKLKNYEKFIVEKQITIFTRNENDFNCLNHGDLWVNNIMFKKDDTNTITDTLLVDYQEGYFGSPGIDLNNFIYTSCNENVQTLHIDELLKYYHTILKCTLEQLNYSHKIPTLKNIKEAIKIKSDHALSSTLCVMPILLIEKKENADAIHFISDDEHSINVRDEVFSNPLYENLLKRLLPKFVNDGIL